MAEKLFENGTIQNKEKGFLEELLEAIPLVADSDDTGNTIEYYDEYGSTLFCVDIVGDNQYLFRFYENAYPVDENALQAINQILGTAKENGNVNKEDVAEAIN